MAFTVADVLYAFRGDLTQYNRDMDTAEAKAQASGQKIGQHLDMSKVLRGVSGAVAGLGGVITAHLLEMDNALAKFRSDTGASASEVKSAQGAIEGAYRQTLTSVDELSQTLAKLRTDMGLSQDEANALLTPFTKFAQITGQTGPDAVRQFDDVLDAFGLTADHAQGIMDQLVKSHQLYGGSVTANTSALSAMAPQLKALNLSLDDGIGLLNLFASKGLDASSAQRALNQAVQRLPAGTTLPAFIAQLSAIEDPAKRAEAAVKIFGSRAGVAMANALGPGVQSLDLFKVSTQEAAGAVDKASDDINGSITNKIKLALHDLVGTMAEWAAPAGPILTGIGATVTGIHAIGNALGIEAGLAGARWAAILGPLAIGAAIAGGSIAAGGALLAAASATGGAAAKADPAASTLRLQAQVAAAIRDTSAAEAAGNLTHQEAEKRIKALQAAYQGMTGVIGPAGQAVAVFTSDTEEMVNRLPHAVDVAQSAVTAGATATKTAAQGWAQDAEEIANRSSAMLASTAATANAAGKAVPHAFAQGVITTRQEPLDAFNTLLAMLKKPMTETAETARLLGELTGKKMAAGLTSADPYIRQQARLTRDTIIDRLNDITPSAGTISKAAMDALAAGMRSKDPVIRAAALGIYQVIEGQLALKDARLWAQHAANAYAEGFASREEYLAEKTRTFLQGAAHQLVAESPPKAGPLKAIHTWARATGLAWVDGFIDAMSTAPKRVSDVLSAMGVFLRNYKPAGNQLGGFTPAADRANLQQYIANLEKQLERTTDPAQRLALYQKIAEYQQRLAAIANTVTTAGGAQAQKLQGYINTLDKALLTETDPAKRKAIIAEIVTYLERIDKLTTKVAKPEARDTSNDARDQRSLALDIQKLDLEHQRALLSATPELTEQNKALLDIIDAQLAQITNQLDQIDYERQHNQLLLDQLNLQRAIAGLKPLSALPPGMAASTPPPPADTVMTGKPPAGHFELRGDTWVWVPDAPAPPPPMPSVFPSMGGMAAAGPGGAPGGNNINVVVNNPAPEPASTSTARELQLLGATGALG